MEMMGDTQEGWTGLGLQGTEVPSSDGEVRRGRWHELFWEQVPRNQKRTRTPLGRSGMLENLASPSTHHHYSAPLSASYNQRSSLILLSLPHYFGWYLANWTLWSTIHSSLVPKANPQRRNLFGSDHLFLPSDQPSFALVQSTVAKPSCGGCHKNPGWQLSGVMVTLGSLLTHPSLPRTFQVLKLKASHPRTLLSSGQDGAVSHSSVVSGMVSRGVLEVQIEWQTYPACPW